MILSGRRLLRVALGSHISGNMAFQSRHFAMVTENVPALGESITEGAIAEWNKVVGEAVSIDDVVCTVETDKVTVEIRSPIAGVLAEQMAAVDDTITVGGALYSLDTEGVATVTTSAEAAPATESAAPVASSSSPPPAAPKPMKHGARVPLIKFLGKRSLLPAASVSTPTPISTANRGAYMDGDGLYFNSLERGALHGRPEITDAEIEAVESGVSPEVDKLFPAPVKKRAF